MFSPGINFHAGAKRRANMANEQENGTGTAMRERLFFLSKLYRKVSPRARCLEIRLAHSIRAPDGNDMRQVVDWEDRPLGEHALSSSSFYSFPFSLWTDRSYGIDVITDYRLKPRSRRNACLESIPNECLQFACVRVCIYRKYVILTFFYNLTFFTMINKRATTIQQHIFNDFFKSSNMYFF